MSARSTIATIFVAGLALVPAAFAACSSEATNPVPPNTVIKTDSGTPVDTGAVADAGVASDVGSTDTANCSGDGGCWTCAPTSNEHFLNRCTSIGCAKFDDKTRIPSATWDGGALPPVP